MARGGFLSRIGKALTGIGEGLARVLGFGKEPAEPPELPEPRYAPPRARAQADRPPRRSRELEIWEDIAVGRDKGNGDLARDWFDLYRDAVTPLELDDDEFYHFWEQFLRAFYLTSGERESLPRDEFYQELGVRKRDFGMDWQEWREIKRGTP